MAGHWTLVTCSWLISFFRNLTSHIPSLPSSCKNQIPNRTTASASHGGATPTCRPVVDSIFVVDDVSLTIDDPAICTLDKKNASGTRSSTAGNSQARTSDLSQPSLVHPIAVLFQSQELGKAVLGFAVPMATGLLFNQQQGLTHLKASAVTLAVALSVGFAATWNGMLLRGVCPRVASAAEHSGVGSILVAFFGLLSSFLPPSLVWACWLCCCFSCLPFLLCLFPPKAVEEESNEERLHQGIAIRNEMTAGNSQARTSDSSRPSPVHPIVVLFQSQELGKAALGFAVPMTTGLLFNQHLGLTHLQASAVALAVSVGFAATWNGMLLRGICPRVASASEHFGGGSILVAFFGLTSSFLPPSLVWACWLCCGFSCLPFLLCLFPLKAVEEESSGERLDQGIATRSSPAGNSQARTSDSSRPSPVHPIAVLFQSQELGKAALGFAVPMATGLLFNQHQGLTHLQASTVTIAVVLSVGFAAAWNGMLLRKVCPRVASASEHFGVGSILVAFFGLMGSFLPPSLVWACWLCCCFSCLPFLLCLFPPKAVEEESSEEHLDQGIATKSGTTAGNSQARTYASSRPSPVHPIAVLFQSQELGKAALGFAVPMATGLLFNQHRGLTHLQASAVMVALSVGFAATWNGMLLRRIYPRVASASEHFGVGSILVAFFGLVSSFLPPSLVWACWLCCGFSCLPFLLCLFPPTAVEEESSGERLDQGIATRSETTTGNSQARTSDSSWPSPVHPMAVLFQSQELGKAALGFAVPMTTGLLFNQHRGLTHLQASAVTVVLSIGFAATWNGMLLRRIYPRVASASEHFGVGSILVAFFGLVSSFLPPSLVWACWLCCGFSCSPFLLCLVPPTAVEEESSGEWLN